MHRYGDGQLSQQARSPPRAGRSHRALSKSAGGRVTQNSPQPSQKRAKIVVMSDQPFVTDVKKLRAQARANIETGAVTSTYQGDAKQTIEILQSVLATEIVCVLRYTMNAISASGIASEGVKDEFNQHAAEEQAHAK